MKPEALTREVLYSSVLQGGVGIVNISDKLQAFHVKHVRDLLAGTPAKWRYLAIYFVGLSLRDYDPSFPSNLIPHSLAPTAFYKLVLASFCRFMAMDYPAGIVGVTFKTVYWHIQQDKNIVPRVVGKVPASDFNVTWQNLCGGLSEAAHRDLAWRVAHRIVPVQGFLYRRGISRDLHCAFCKLPETLEHAFISCELIVDIWLFAEALLAKMAAWQVSLSAYVVLYCAKVSGLSKGLSAFLYMLINMAKSVIWDIRCQVRFDGKVFTPEVVVSFVKQQLRDRCRLDFCRLGRQEFVEIWCVRNAFCCVSDAGDLVFK